MIRIWKTETPGPMRGLILGANGGSELRWASRSLDERIEMIKRVELGTAPVLPLPVTIF